MGRTDLPSISWKWGPDVDKRRLLEQLCVAVSGFYNRKGMLIVPKVNPQLGRKQVVIPECVAKLTQDDWVKIEKKSTEWPITIPDQWLVEMVGKWKLVGVDDKTVSEKKREVEVVWPELWKVLGNFFGREILRIGEVEFRLTNCGTSASHYILEDGKRGQKLVVNWRVDTDVSEAVGMIILALLWPYDKKLGYSWSRRMAIRDFLMETPELKRMFGNYQRIELEERRITETDINISRIYMQRVGIVVRNDEMEKLKIAGFKMGSKEKAVVDMLWRNRGETVNFDSIADSLWGEGEFKSFWAINKMVQRIRKKLIDEGVNGANIKTLRGRGYVWV